MSPQVRFAIRVGVVAVVAGLSSLQAALPGLDTAEILQALLATIVAGGVYTGIGVATPIEPSVGKGSE